MFWILRHLFLSFVQLLKNHPAFGRNGKGRFIRISACIGKYLHRIIFTCKALKTCIIRNWIYATIALLLMGRKTVLYKISTYFCMLPCRKNRDLHAWISITCNDRHEVELTWFHMLHSTSHFVRIRLLMLVSTRCCVRTFLILFEEVEIEKFCHKKKYFGGLTSNIYLLAVKKWPYNTGLFHYNANICITDNFVYYKNRKNTSILA
jgi:hypothetical protein